MAYVYGIRVDGVIRYIGKGTRKSERRSGHSSRFNDHMRAVRRLVRCREEGVTFDPGNSCLAVIVKLAHEWIDGAQIVEHIFADGLTNRQALTREDREIAACPKGQLWNSGTNAEVASRNGAAGRGKPKSKACREKQSQSQKAYWADQTRDKSEHIARMRKPKRKTNVVQLATRRALP